MKDFREHHRAGLREHPGPDRKRFKGETVVQQSPPTTTTTSQGPWEQQQPYLTQGFQEAKRQLESEKPGYFPGTTVTPFAPETELGLGLQTAQALDPSSLVGQAQTQTGRTLRGDYLAPDNPVFRSMMEGVRDVVQPQVDTAFAGAGRFGSPGHAEAMGRGISSGMTPYLAAERERQFGATASAYPISQYAPQLLSQVGAQREALGRETLQEKIDRYNYEQNVEAQKLQQYMGAISGTYGGEGVSRTTQPIYRNPLMQGLGAASSIAGIGQAAFAPQGGGGFMSK